MTERITYDASQGMYRVEIRNDDNTYSTYWCYDRDEAEELVREAHA